MSFSDGDCGLKQMSVLDKHEVEEQVAPRRRLSNKTTFAKILGHTIVEAGIDAELELKVGVSMELFWKSFKKAILIVTRPIGRAALLLTLGVSGLVHLVKWIIN